MRTTCTACLAGLALLLLVLPATVSAGGADAVDTLLTEAISRRMIAGGVVLIGNRSGVVLQRAYGRVSPDPAAPPAAVGTIFDVASLTKVLATAPAVLKLADEGKLRLDDPVAKWFPELDGRGKEGLRIVHLLTHTSGLDDKPLRPESPLQGAIALAAEQVLKAAPGCRFRYADINFVLLGELVRRASGARLDRYAAEAFFIPLGMTDTGFNPAGGLLSRVAPTLAAGGAFLSGSAQDPSARLLDGVAGHAGLFSTVRDISLFCRMMLGDGEVDGRRVLSPDAVREMTAPRAWGGAVRGLGWDIASPYSSPKGSAFSATSFGHTGYTGSSVWIDPASDVFVVLLTSRLSYGRTRELNQLRSDLSTLAAASFAQPPAGAPGEPR